MRRFFVPLGRTLLQGSQDRISDGVGDRRGEGISNLAIGRCFSAAKFPVIGKSLKPGDHSKGQPRKPIHRKFLIRSRIPNSQTIHPKFPPGRSRTGRSQISTSVLFRATHQSRPDPIRLPYPTRASRPTIPTHKIRQKVAHTRIASRRRRPPEKTGKPTLYRHQHKARTELGDAKIRSVHHPHFHGIAEPPEGPGQFRPVIPELRRGKARHIFQKDRRGIALPHDAQCLGKEIPLIRLAALFSRNRERRARHTRRQ